MSRRMYNAEFNVPHRKIIAVFKGYIRFKRRNIRVETVGKVKRFIRKRRGVFLAYRYFHSGFFSQIRCATYMVKMRVRKQDKALLIAVLIKKIICSFSYKAGINHNCRFLCAYKITVCFDKSQMQNFNFHFFSISRYQKVLSPVRRLRAKPSYRRRRCLSPPS